MRERLRCGPSPRQGSLLALALIRALLNKIQCLDEHVSSVYVQIAIFRIEAGY